MIGVDEVGRGSWAGPLLVAAARLHEDINGLTDSKALTKKQRERLCSQIQTSADIGFGWMSAQQVDQLGLAECLRIATKCAVTSLKPLADEEIVIDGTVNFLPGREVTLKTKAELAYPCVAAASIAAKVFRDHYMTQLHKKLPEYSFDKHVGYGTAVHLAALQTHGVTLWHRMSYKPIKLISDATMAT